MMDLPPALRARLPVWQRTPYQDFGRDLSGWDCWGLVAYVGREAFGDAHEQFAGAVPRDGASIATAVAAGLPLYDEAAACAGAVALAVWKGRPLHVGLMLTARHMLHATRHEGTLLTDLTQDDTWMRRVERGGFFILR